VVSGGDGRMVMVVVLAVVVKVVVVPAEVLVVVKVEVVVVARRGRLGSFSRRRPCFQYFFMPLTFLQE